MLIRTAPDPGYFSKTSTLDRVKNKFYAGLFEATKKIWSTQKFGKEWQDEWKGEQQGHENVDKDNNKKDLLL